MKKLSLALYFFNPLLINIKTNKKKLSKFRNYFILFRIVILLLLYLVYGYSETLDPIYGLY